MDPHIQQRFDARYSRHYYFNSVTKKSGWSVEDVASPPPPTPPAAPPPDPPNPYPHIQQRFDARYKRNYYFNSQTRKSGWSMAEVLEPETAVPTPTVRRGGDTMKTQMSTYGKGAKRRSLAGGGKKTARQRDKKGATASFDGDPSFDLDQKAEEDLEDFYYNQLSRAAKSREVETSDADLERLTKLAANSRSSAEELAEEGKRQAKIASEMWAKKAELQAKMAAGVAEEEARNRLSLQERQTSVIRRKKEQISAQAKAEKEHRFAVRRRIELEEKLQREQAEAERDQFEYTEQKRKKALDEERERVRLQVEEQLREEYALKAARLKQEVDAQELEKKMLEEFERQMREDVRSRFQLDEEERLREEAELAKLKHEVRSV
jgi:hypothetical protein